MSKVKHKYGEHGRFVASAINNFGQGQHPVATDDNLHQFRDKYVRSVLKKSRKYANPKYQNVIDSLLKEETMDPIRQAIEDIQQGNLEQMRQNLSQALAQKAVDKLEEKKLEIASTYFGIK